MDFLLITAGFVSGAAVAMGLGGGSVLILYLTFIAGMEQSQSRALNLAFFIPIALLSVLMHSEKGLLDKKSAIISGIFAALGAAGGIAVSGAVSNEWLRRIFGVFLCLVVLRETVVIVKEITKKIKERYE